MGGAGPFAALRHCGAGGFHDAGWSIGAMSVRSEMAPMTRSTNEIAGYNHSIVPRSWKYQTMEARRAGREARRTRPGNPPAIFRLLVEAGPEGMNAGAIAEALEVPAATLSFHVAQLARAGLVTSRQESRFIYLLDQLRGDGRPDRLPHRQLLSGRPMPAEDAEDCHHRQGRAPRRPERIPGSMLTQFSTFSSCVPAIPPVPSSARAILNHLGKGRVRPIRAGSNPGGEVNPVALETLAKHGPGRRLRSKTWDEFAAPGAPPIDFIFTVCDNAAGEPCPIWPGQPMTAHWGIADPAHVEGPTRQAPRLRRPYRCCRQRIEAFPACRWRADDGASTDDRSARCARRNHSGDMK